MARLCALRVLFSAIPFLSLFFYRSLTIIVVIIFFVVQRHKWIALLTIVSKHFLDVKRSYFLLHFFFYFFFSLLFRSQLSCNSKLALWFNAFMIVASYTSIFSNFKPVHSNLSSSNVPRFCYYKWEFVWSCGCKVINVHVDWLTVICAYAGVTKNSKINIAKAIHTCAIDFRLKNDWTKLKWAKRIDIWISKQLHWAIRTMMEEECKRTQEKLKQA